MSPPARSTPPPPPVTPQPKAVVPRSFTFYQPSVPVTLPKPIDGLTRGEIRALITKMYEVRRRLTAPLVASGKQAPTQSASQAQSRGYTRLLSSYGSAQSKASEPVPKSLSRQELTAMYIADVEAELIRWEQYEWAGNDTMGTINLVEFWKAHRNIFPLLYQIAMNVLPVQASSVSSERAFSSAKLTCTRERNNISAEPMEYLQVLKHSLHRRQANHNNNQTLDFMAHIVNPAGEESIDD